MKKTINHSITFLSLLALLFGLAFFAPQLAAANEDHEAHEEHDMMSDEGDSEAGRIAKLETILELLQQLVTLLQMQAGESAMDMDTDAMHEMSEEAYEAELHILVEVHVDETHVHVHEPGEEEIAFFVDFDISEEAAIITAIAAETGLSEVEIEAAITFDDGSDEHEHEHDEDEEGDDMYEGIHIMGDGTVMLGNGDVVDDATITDDGMIELADGTVLEPEFDLR